MATVLLIETSTSLCSVALEKDGVVVASRDSGTFIPAGASEPVGDRSHAAYTAVFCDEVLREAGIRASGLDAVCISEGPGSYTGLRVGLSTAKGICFASGCKLLSVCSTDVLAAAAVPHLAGDKSPAAKDICHIVPMIDARRMEVYSAKYRFSGKPGTLPERISAVEAIVVDEKIFNDIAGNTLFIGDGALKSRDVVGKGTFIDRCPAASDMAALAEREYAAAAWRDVAYFEPFYLKEFVATTPKKLF